VQTFYVHEGYLFFNPLTCLEKFIDEKMHRRRKEERSNRLYENCINSIFFDVEK
jgi:hypothetical protein